MKLVLLISCIIVLIQFTNCARSSRVQQYNSRANRATIFGDNNSINQTVSDLNVNNSDTIEELNVTVNELIVNGSTEQNVTVDQLTVQELKNNDIVDTVTVDKATEQNTTVNTEIVNNTTVNRLTIPEGNNTVVNSTGEVVVSGRGRSVATAPERRGGRSSNCKAGEVYDIRNQRCRKTRRRDQK